MPVLRLYGVQESDTVSPDQAELCHQERPEKAEANGACQVVTWHDPVLGISPVKPYAGGVSDNACLSEIGKGNDFGSGNIAFSVFYGTSLLPYREKT
jgi:hypothetical protein